ncbi:MAG: response regulator transcription factor [Planctomycetes bacterium]|nr:response regulator transcription factor [Planctomycetota bacterium]
MVTHRILIVEDESELARTLKENLEIEGFQAEVAATGERALELLRFRTFHLVILDLLLPGINGFDVCKALRKDGSRVPVLMLTALGETHQKIKGLEIGADDYVTKPFSLGELLARVKAILRRASGEGFEEPAFCFRGIEIDFDRYEVRRGKRVEHLAHTEREMLRLLVARAGEPIRRSEFLDAIWGIEAFPTNRTVDNYIVKLRRKVEPDPANPRHIVTVHGVGYKFVP